MKRKYLWLLAAGLVMALLALAACTAPAEEAPATEKPAAEEPAKEPAATPASIVKGGAIYDKWWKAVAGAAEPTGDMPLWATQSTNAASGTGTWRCKECHGWDYKGAAGAYASGSHATGFPGVYNAGMSKSRSELEGIMAGDANADHDFSTVLGDEGVKAVASFLSEGLIDDSKYIDYSTKGVIGADLANGKTLFDGTCAACHGSDGRMIEIDGKFLADLANGNPWEVLHKIRFGQPDGAMPAAINAGWSVQDTVDVLGYAQTLSE